MARNLSKAGAEVSGAALSPECAETAELLSPYADGMTSAEESARVAAHLAVCPRCESEYRTIRAFSEALRALPEREVPEAFSPRLRAALALERRAGTREGARGSVWRRRAATLAAVFVVGFASLWVYGRFGADDGIPDASGSRPTETEFEATVADSGGASAADIRDDAPAGETETAPPRVTEGTGISLYEDEGVSPTRGTTGAGIGRGIVIETRRDRLIRDRLAGFEYEILSEDAEDDAYTYRILIVSNASGVLFNEEIKMLVRGDEVTVLFASEFLGL